MNKRDYKEFVQGCFYHVYNRGNFKQEIFKDDQDYLNFLKRFALILDVQVSKAAFDTSFSARGNRVRIPPLPKNSFTIVSYCLMPNHFHFFIRQNDEIPISKLILKLCSSYSKYFNKKYDKVGHLFQDRFKAVRIGNDSHFLWLSEYIHQNPVEAGLVASAHEWKWSSHSNHKKQQADEICDPSIIFESIKNIKKSEDKIGQEINKIGLLTFD